MRERIKNLLIGGLKASEIVSIVGCTPSYVSQLLKDEEFRKSVEDGMMAAASDKKEEDHLDIRYQNTEHKLLTAMENSLGEASLGEISKALDVINRRKESKRSVTAPGSVGNTTNINVVSLTLPAHAIQNHQPVVSLNGNKEIIAIDALPLAPMSSTGVKNLFEQMRARELVREQQPMLSAEDL